MVIILYDTIHDFSFWLRTGSNLAKTDLIQSQTWIYFLRKQLKEPNVKCSVNIFNILKTDTQEISNENENISSTIGSNTDENKDEFKGMDNLILIT